MISTAIARLPQGVPQTDGRIKIAVSFHPDLFARLRARAAKRGETFSEVINDCVKCGLFDLEEAGE